jgi:CheY-like chemotaxis protein
MSDSVKNFGATAKSPAHNPLGIIALFLVLVYGLACMVITLGSTLAPTERLPLVYFLVVFPVLVLGVFTWLVSQHSGKLFAPADFKNVDNYVKMQLAAVASLTAATAKGSAQASESDLQGIVKTIQEAKPASVGAMDAWKRQVLWVDDRPENNVYERGAFEALGLQFTLCLSTAEALERLRTNKFAAIISDMGRKEGPREGYTLLDALREKGDKTPLVFYCGSDSPEKKREAEQHGGQGSTNNPQELFRLMIAAVISSAAT